MTDQTAQLEWRDTDAGAVPVSKQFDDPYFSLDNGLAETNHVFLSGNDLPKRFVDEFHVAELGFGTGLNFLATLEAFRQSNTVGVLRYTSFEAYPMSKDDLQRALSHYPSLPNDPLQSGIQETINGPDFHLEIIVDDAQDALPNWCEKADAWYLDGFSPAKNPELWSQDILKEVGIHTNVGGTFATYTAAGHVRRSLEVAGFDVLRVPGFGRKRHMTIGTKIDGK